MWLILELHFFMTEKYCIHGDMPPNDSFTNSTYTNVALQDYNA